VESTQALIEEARRRHRRRRLWTAATVVLLAACVGFVIVETGGTGRSGPAYNVERHQADRSSWCTSGPVKAVPGAYNAKAGALPATDGLCGGIAVRGMTLVGSSPFPLYESKGTDRGPFTAAQLGLQRTLGQFWVLTSAVDAFGPKHLVLPIPTSFLHTRPGPAEVSVTVYSFDNDRSPQRLLNSPDYNHEPGWTEIRSASNQGWRIIRVTSAGLAGLNDYILQGSLGSQWIEVAVIGLHVTLDEAREVANAATA
jgi:hypothetical protein